MQVGFFTKKLCAQLGQKVDATPCTVVSSTALGEANVPFGSLLVFDEADANLCKVPSAKSHLDKLLGIALRENYGQDYPPKTPMRVLRQGRVWIKCADDISPADAVYVVIGDDGARFSNKAAEGAVKLKCAIYLEKPQSGLAPIEINFLGGMQ